VAREPSTIGVSMPPAKRENLSGAYGHCCPIGHRRVIQFCRHVGAGEGDHAVARKAQRRTDELAFEGSGIAIVADQQVGQPE
jgi:hypothetical protein